MYIDPNTGGVLFQALAAGFAAVVTFLLVFAGRIRAGFAGLRRKLRRDDSQAETKEVDKE